LLSSSVFMGATLQLLSFDPQLPEGPFFRSTVSEKA